VIRNLKVIFEKLFKINDTPEKISAGIGLGIFSGILPGTGPAAALFLALIFKVNRAGALLASLLTNTWLSFATFILAIKIGSAILKTDWIKVKYNFETAVKNFHWPALFKLPFLEIIFPVLAGYIIIAAVSGLCGYFLTLLILRRYLKWKQIS